MLQSKPGTQGKKLMLVLGRNLENKVITDGAQGKAKHLVLVSLFTRHAVYVSLGCRRGFRAPRAGEIAAFWLQAAQLYFDMGMLR